MLNLIGSQQFRPQSPVGGGQFFGLNFGSSNSPTSQAFGFGQGPAGIFSGSRELGQDQSLSGITGLMQGMMMNMMMMQMMQMMQALQGMVSGQNAASGAADFGSGATGAVGGGVSSGGGGGGGGAAPASGGSSDAAAAGGSTVASKEKTGKIVDVPGGKLDAAIAGAVVQMMKDAKKDGVDLKITSSYRSRQQQEVLYAKYKAGTGNLAAKPGTSNHESGLAIDFTNTKGAYAWLAKNAGRYGLKNLPGEPWHYSPSGR